MNYREINQKGYVSPGITDFIQKNGKMLDNLTLEQIKTVVDTFI